MRRFGLGRAVPRSALAALAAIAAACSGSGSGEAGPPAIEVSVASVAFEATEAGADPAPRSFTVSNGGGGTLSRPTLAVSHGSGQEWLVATVAGESAPFTVTLQPVLGTLPAGTHAATVAVRSNGASNTPRLVPVTLSVAKPPRAPAIQLSPASVAFGARSHRGDPLPQQVSVTSDGDVPLAPPSVAVTYDGAAGGWLGASVAGAAAPYTITLQPVIRDLGAGTYRASVSIESPGATSASLAVTLTLTPTWTVFVYGHADNARSTSLLRDLQAMDAASLGDAVRVVVAADWSAGRRLPTGDSFPSGTEWYRIVGGGQGPELLWTVGEQDLDDPAVLSEAVAGALYAFPADRFAVVLWGRGASWRGGYGGDEHDTPGGQGMPMSPEHAAAALSAALASVGRTEPLDVVAFDAPSLLGQEVAFAFRDVAATFVATGDVDGGGGWDYAATLGRLAASPGMSGPELAMGEVRDWDARHAAQGGVDLVGRAHAALDLSRLRAYGDAWAALAGAMAGSGSPDWLAVARRQFRALPGYGAADPGDPDAQPVLRDAGQLLDALASLSSDPATAEAAAAARDALDGPDGAVLARSLGTVRSERAQAGLHGEAALGTDWPARAEAYAALGWDAHTRWSDVLWLVAGNADAEAPAIDRLAQNTDGATPQTPPLVQVRSGDSDVAAARLSVARLDASGAATSYGAVAEVDVEPSGGWYDLPWDLTLPLLDDGAAQSHAFVLPWMRGGSAAVALLPGAVRDGAVSVEAYAILVEGAARVDAFALRGNGALAVVPAADLAGLEFTPSLRDEASGAWVAGTPLTIPPAPNPALAFERALAPPGTYRLVTSMADVWGNVGTASDDVTVAP